MHTGCSTCLSDVKKTSAAGEVLTPPPSPSSPERQGQGQGQGQDQDQDQGRSSGRRRVASSSLVGLATTRPKRRKRRGQHTTERRVGQLHFFIPSSIVYTGKYFLKVPVVNTSTVTTSNASVRHNGGTSSPTLPSGSSRTLNKVPIETQ